MQIGKFLKIVVLSILSFFAIDTNADAVIDKHLSTKTISIGVVLNWSTSLEKGVDIFSIEKSQNGIHFSQIAKVQSQGSKEAGFEYSFVDLYPDNGTSHYRLKVINTDGSFAYSEKITTKLIPKTNFTISNFSSTNPNDNWHVNLNVYVEGSMVYEWTSLDGNIIDQGIKRMKEGINNLEFSMQDWPDGIYRIDLSMSEDKKSLTIQKLGDTTIQVGIQKQ